MGKNYQNFLFFKIPDNLNIFISNYQYNHLEVYQIKGFLLKKI